MDSHLAIPPDINRIDGRPLGSAYLVEVGRDVH